MPPGTTVLPVASITRPACSQCSGKPRATMRSPSMATSQRPTPCGVTTSPPRMTRSSIARSSSDAARGTTRRPIGSRQCGNIDRINLILDYGNHAADRDGAADRDRAPLQPLLHQADRAPRRELSRDALLADRSAGAVRAGAPRAAVGDRAGARAGARRGLSEPHSPRLRAAPAAHPRPVQVRRPAEPSHADRAGPRRVRAARRAVAPGHRRVAGAAPAPPAAPGDLPDANPPDPAPRRAPGGGGGRPASPAARRLYQAAGFRRVHREKHRSFGRELVGETWELAL